ncbi:hypothetical protein SDC9_69978 [bioreactor metagenome]|uniref:Uncharacterized protein n=1 Tax=bioreactor metagenome TaxID=1076179 RepID=A0A644YBK1_9ZZZZ
MGGLGGGLQFRLFRSPSVNAGKVRRLVLLLRFRLKKDIPNALSLCGRLLVLLNLYGLLHRHCVYIVLKRHIDGRSRLHKGLLRFEIIVLIRNFYDKVLFFPFFFLFHFSEGGLHKLSYIGDPCAV